MSHLRAAFESLARYRKGFLRLAILALLNVVVYLAVTHRLANKQERLATEQTQLSLELAERSSELESLSGAATRATRNAQAVSRFWDEVVEARAPGLTEAWDEIDRLAGETNVTRGRTGYDREILDVGLEQISAKMPVEGKYFDLVRFINRLERSERFFLVDEVTISQRETDESIRLECSIAFYLKAETLGGAAGP